MISPLDDFYLQKSEPVKGCLLALKSVILALNKDITAEWKYKLPFFYYKGKPFCYLWLHKKFKLPYIGVVESKHIDHEILILEKRSRIKIMLIDPDQDLPIETIIEVLKLAMTRYQ